MAPTLTATPNPTLGVVDLVVTGALGAITVVTYAPNALMGTGAYTVRGAFANGKTVPDYDAPLNVDLVYIATDAGPPVTQSAQVETQLDSDTAWLSAQNSPAPGLPVTVMADRDQNYVGYSVAHKVLNTSAPLVTIQPMAYRSGTYELLARTVGEFLNLRQLLLPGGVLLLRSPCQTEYLDTAFIVTDSGFGPELNWNAAPPRWRTISISYQSVTPDTTPPVEIAWTWDDVDDDFPTWLDLLALPTWLDVLTHDPAAP